ncbi:MAG TPA: RecX family transcriptional regulator [Chthoniobacterales bacterium]|nr:RecX family transcriptional regulator [Chthoniobacterales bacterium]
MAAPSKPKKLGPEELWNYALRLLAQRPYSVAELKTKLSRRSESASVIADTVAKLREYGMADDEKFSEAFASSRLQNDGFGRSRVLRDLRAKRVPRPIAEKAVERTFAKTEEQELATQFLLRKYRNKNLRELLKDHKHFAGAYRKLRVAGFSSGVSISLLKRYASETAEWIEPEPEEDEA